MPLPIGAGCKPAAADRWDGKDPHAWHGQYGGYLSDKVKQCFPKLYEGVVS